MSGKTFIDCIYSDSFSPDATLTDRKDYLDSHKKWARLRLTISNRAPEPIHSAQPG